MIEIKRFGRLLIVNHELGRKPKASYAVKLISGERFNNFLKHMPVIW